MPKKHCDQNLKNHQIIYKSLKKLFPKNPEIICEKKLQTYFDKYSQMIIDMCYDKDPKKYSTIYDFLEKLFSQKIVCEKTLQIYHDTYIKTIVNKCNDKSFDTCYHNICEFLSDLFSRKIICEEYPDSETICEFLENFFSTTVTCEKIIQSYIDAYRELWENYSSREENLFTSR